MKLVNVFFLTVISSLMLIDISAQTNSYEKQLEDWENRRFGMFIHWGPVSIKGYELSWSRGEQLTMDEYENLYKEFNPVDFDADEWVSLAKTAGMKYIILTAKHHDGFCLWNTRQTEYNIMNTPFKRDIVKELSEACKKYGMKLGLYYSVIDWHQPDFPLIGYLPENASPEIEKMVMRDRYDLDAYTTYLKNQLAELLVNYGPLYVLWFDVPQMFDEKRGQEVIDFIRQIQPDIIVNNRSGAKGDYDTPEQHVGEFSEKRPFETCMTIADQWGWKPNDDLKSFEQLMHILIRSAGGNGNFLLNIGPMGNGKFEKVQTDRLGEIGTWLQNFGHTVYGTRGGPFLPTDWGVSTSAGSTIYIHILKWMGEATKIILPDFGMDIQSCRIVNNDESVKLSRKHGNHVIEFSRKALEPVNTIIELKVNGNTSDIKPIKLESQSLSYKHHVAVSKAPDLWWNAVNNINNGDWALPWIPAKDDKNPWAEIDFSKPLNVTKVVIYEKGHAIKAFKIQCLVNEKWETVYKGKSIGPELAVKLPEIITQKIRLVLTEFSEYPGIYEFSVY
jgi:alpha-L-fucosidase